MSHSRPISARSRSIRRGDPRCGTSRRGCRPMARWSRRPEASLEAAAHVSPEDQDVRRELVEVATELQDFELGAKHLAELADLQAGARKGDTLLALADCYYDKLEDAPAGRHAMRAAADAFGF